MTAEALEVFFADRRVGTLESAADDALRFGYDPGWLAAAGRFAISASLPLRADPYDTPAARAFFTHLLPEGSVRQAVAQCLGVSEGNDFALLRALGGDCAGALALLDSAEPEAQAAVGREGAVEPLPPARLAGMVGQGGALARVDLQGGIRLSLAGTQDKLPVQYRGDAFFLPRGRTASTHIAKLPDPSFPHMLENEFFCSLLARDLGLETCRSELVSVEDTRVLVVTRYDRTREDGVVARLHQEDLCQALGLPPSRKYEREGGPSFADCVRVITDVSANPARDVLALVRWLAFCTVLGNADGHAKNLSLLRSADGRWQLAPFYDLVCTALYAETDRNLALRVGETADWSHIRGRDWRALAEQIEVGARLVLRAVEDIAERIEAAACARLAWYREQYGAPALLEQLPALLHTRSRRIRERLAE